MMNSLTDYAAWYAAWLWWSVQGCVRDMWEGIPGPTPVKIAVMVLLGVCLLIPGPLDEIGVVLALRGIAHVRRRRRGKETQK